ncbi:hypothetical protein FB561_3891 [Kribbella amoyensis]|uniref:DUF5652 domain-containing protein n=1 Tax=Kribbella amoyensis TaxID=996641 RepID=A0A561BVA3_9ACTN|nr:hypothetical protein [Kribbella amoyensis]TWD82751.1 hypothetical protein FB561_3891 [Kribbella amoyensis]
MGRKAWGELSPQEQKLAVAGGAVDGVLRLIALVDLKRRSAGEVRGSRGVWAISVGLVNSMGLVPIAYFLFGRRKAHP